MYAVGAQIHRLLSGFHNVTLSVLQFFVHFSFLSFLLSQRFMTLEKVFKPGKSRCELCNFTNFFISFCSFFSSFLSVFLELLLMAPECMKVHLELDLEFQLVNLYQLRPFQDLPSFQGKFGFSKTIYTWFVSNSLLSDFFS